jgi:hypothetical protein
MPVCKTGVNNGILTARGFKTIPCQLFSAALKADFFITEFARSRHTVSESPAAQENRNCNNV